MDHECLDFLLQRMPHLACLTKGGIGRNEDVPQDFPRTVESAFFLGKRKGHHIRGLIMAQVAAIVLANGWIVNQEETNFLLDPQFYADLAEKFLQSPEGKAMRTVEIAYIYRRSPWH